MIGESSKKHKVEFFVSEIIKGDVNPRIIDIKGQINEWLSKHKTIRIHKMYMSMAGQYPIFWIWYDE